MEGSASRTHHRQQNIESCTHNTHTTGTFSPKWSAANTKLLILNVFYLIYNSNKIMHSLQNFKRNYILKKTKKNNVFVYYYQLIMFGLDSHFVSRERSMVHPIIIQMDNVWLNLCVCESETECNLNFVFLFLNKFFPEFKLKHIICFLLSSKHCLPGPLPPSEFWW